MSIDVITMIAIERDRLLNQLIKPHMPEWPHIKEGVTFRNEIGSMLVFVRGALVGGIDESEGVNHLQNGDLEVAIKHTLFCWKQCDKVRKRAVH